MSITKNYKNNINGSYLECYQYFKIQKQDYKKITLIIAILLYLPYIIMVILFEKIIFAFLRQILKTP